MLNAARRGAISVEKHLIGALIGAGEEISVQPHLIGPRPGQNARKWEFNCASTLIWANNVVTKGNKCVSTFQQLLDIGRERENVKPASSQSWRCSRVNMTAYGRHSHLRVLFVVSRHRTISWKSKRKVGFVARACNRFLFIMKARLNRVSMTFVVGVQREMSKEEQLSGGESR
ncbi:hypothetical protein OMP40_23360 [Cohnella rhizosphaerae]|uniref:Uncharacterized protein n=1 Tax=Cohnella rhizosphaerae TaxID=1457232 RepID=A0A9X4KWT1_9BACL|nr:hypothetical protein [Cohnella rhizosphaerae]MDG0811973.1 hypothetical protein [Cohnella rhizosphaerae]